MSLLALSDVSKRFGGVNALADVSFAVEQGGHCQTEVSRRDRRR